MGMLVPDGPPQRLAVHRDHYAGAGAGLVAQERGSDRLQLLGRDVLREDAAERVVVRYPRARKTQRQAQLVSALAHPIGDPARAVLPGEFGEHD